MAASSRDRADREKTATRKPALKTSSIKEAQIMPVPSRRVAAALSAPFTPAATLALQRTLGNRAVQRLLARTTRPPTAASGTPLPDQRGEAPTILVTVQRDDQPAKDPPIQTAHGSGMDLPAPVRSKMEAAFATDFSDVRVYENPAVAAMGAIAYAQDHDLHFAPGHYNPHSQAGQAVLGHELTHVVQQQQGRVRSTGQAIGLPLNDDPALEREADQLGRKAAAQPAIGTGGLQAGNPARPRQRASAPAPRSGVCQLLTSADAQKIWHYKLAIRVARAPNDLRGSSYALSDFDLSEMQEDDERFAMIAWVNDPNDGVRQSWEEQLVRTINYIKGFEPWGKLLLLIKSVRPGSKDYGSDTFAKSHGIPENAEVLANASLDNLFSTVSVIGWIKGKIAGIPAPQNWIDHPDDQALVGGGNQLTEAIAKVHPPEGGDWLTAYILRAKHALALAQNLKQRLTQQGGDPTQQEFTSLVQVLYETYYVSLLENIDTDYPVWAEIKEYVDGWRRALADDARDFDSVDVAAELVNKIIEITG